VTTRMRCGGASKAQSHPTGSPTKLMSEATLKAGSRSALTTTREGR
jgi:hypothetical protein